MKTALLLTKMVPFKVWAPLGFLGFLFFPLACLILGLAYFWIAKQYPHSSMCIKRLGLSLQFQISAVRPLAMTPIPQDEADTSARVESPLTIEVCVKRGLIVQLTEQFERFDIEQRREKLKENAYYLFELAIQLGYTEIVAYFIEILKPMPNTAPLNDTFQLLNLAVNSNVASVFRMISTACDEGFVKVRTVLTWFYSAIHHHNEALFLEILKDFKKRARDEVAYQRLLQSVSRYLSKIQLRTFSLEARVHLRKMFAYLAEDLASPGCVRVRPRPIPLPRRALMAIPVVVLPAKKEELGGSSGEFNDKANVVGEILGLPGFFSPRSSSR